MNDRYPTHKPFTDPAWSADMLRDYESNGGEIYVSRVDWCTSTGRRISHDIEAPTEAIARLQTRRLTGLGANRGYEVFAQDHPTKKG
jgi:hypothetical protein